MTLYIEPQFKLINDARMLIRHVCSCGRETLWSALDVDGGQLAHAEMSEHLIDDHPSEVPAGRCAHCGVITNYFRARTTVLEHHDGATRKMPVDAWLCERHGPSTPTVVDQAEDAPCEP